MMDVKGYTKYKYSYTSDKKFVRYGNVSLEYGDDGSLTLDDITGDLSAYYWDQDKEHRKKPLLMEVTLGGEFRGMKAYYSNKGEQNNGKWRSIVPKHLDVENGLRFPPDELEEQLHELKCQLLNPVVIDITKPIGRYKNTCYEGKNCGNESCTENVTVDDYRDSQYEEIDLEKYTAWKHTYRGKNFTIAGFKTDPSEGNTPLGLTILDVKEVLVLFEKSEKGPPGATSKPLIAYIKTGSGNIYGWSKNFDQNGKWAEEKILKGIKLHAKTEQDEEKEAYFDEGEDGEKGESGTTGSVTKAAGEKKEASDVKPAESDSANHLAPEQASGDVPISGVTSNGAGEDSVLKLETADPPPSVKEEVILHV
ncbi:hypothetical protein BEWA_000610 [Theileria equi strain WA]|uniref:Uncharacterized protein n=1 Tax=Theileria equi strain WA TaxID=1537102 RepID=L0B068_THEEQ|nr:hypothetical protein BEWA_000610 [Theileria equi strain WA]AFZ80656.1 hypothetical protein BEWA_000610 [Theileria equi strain WA]|eukprot:XP_004830322.1 hypothetical protein BEWA_000610 [Theileria equi strain WA]